MIIRSFDAARVSATDTNASNVPAVVMLIVPAAWRGLLSSEILLPDPIHGGRTGDLQRDTNQVFYPFLATTISAVAFAGFWFTYFSPILGGSYPAAGAALHVHGWSFFLWYLLFPAQAWLITQRERGLHRMVGKVSVLLVVLMSLTGILVLSVRVDEAVRNGEPRVWLMYGPLILSNLLLFISFYSAGIWMAARRRLAAHKRLMVVASAIALGAGSFRLVLFLSGFHPLSLPIGVLACSLFIIVGAIHDWVSRGAVHAVYLIGLVVMFAVEVTLLPQVSQTNVAWVNQWLAAIGEQIGFLYDPEPTVEF